ncbi:hypothetical protein ABW19_dt0202669 [Dactylella cylindrospora]|nr:hypothetical protein ABW19_dt0202669 [Dactylella cylindrospora]
MEQTKIQHRDNTSTQSAASVPQIIDCDDLSQDGESEDETYTPLNPLADELLKRCIALSDEIALLEKKMVQRLPPKQRSKKGNLPIELRHFKYAIQVEQRLLEALSYKTPTQKTLHSLRSSNLKFLESVWSVAKRCTGLQVIFRTVYLISNPPPGLPKLKGKEKKDLKKKKTPVQVDIIAQSGLEWIKVANISQKRLETEFAKARWEAEGFKEDDSSDSEPDDESSSATPTTTQNDEIKDEDLVQQFQRDSDAFSLVKSARLLVQAAQQIRVQYLHPEITIFLPNITYDAENPDASSPVHNLITAILSTGARVQTANNLIPSTSPPDNIEDTITTLSRSADPINLITGKIVMDCTMLLALASDLSNEDVPEKPVFHRYILQQARAEKEEPLLPHWMYPCIAGREMVCTFDAYKRFREIVEIVGSEREKARAEVLVCGPKDWKHPSTAEKGRRCDGSFACEGGDGTPAELRGRLQSLSKHTVPDDLLLPIKVIDSTETELISRNEVAAKIGPELSSVNRSSLFTAWEMGVTIVTTNGSVIKRLEWLIEENRIRDDDAGPKVHLLAIARSLVGKMKRGEEILKDG